MLVSVTRLRLRSWRYVPGFVRDSAASLGGAIRAAGFIDGKLLADRHLAFWTATRWRDEAAMRAWLGMGAHGRAMPRLANWCDEASVVRWQQPDGAPFPAWGECHERMTAEGRASAVRFPTQAHVARCVPSPREGRVRLELPFRAV